ncbi:MAG: hypothetical protein ABL986_14995 [Vicinamibacterales bacterium]
MTRRWIEIGLAATALLLGVVVGGRAQSSSVPRTPWGAPDLQGTWTNATLTPLQRPAALAGKEVFTPDEAAAYVKARVEQASAPPARPAPGATPNVGSYNDVFMERGVGVVKSLRTSLVIEPKDGRVPPMTPAAQEKWAAIRADRALHPADGPENRSMLERCLLFGAAGPPMLPEPYNANYQIVQTRDYVVILVEMVHDARIIPLDGRPHLPAGTTRWLGDSRGHWEGDTLVVETTNLRFDNHGSRFGVGYDTMSDENLKVVERFTRTDAMTITYRATIEDPTVFVSPWTLEMSMAQAKGPVLEYACHEGNYGLPNILSGARAEEKATGTSARRP